MQNTPVFNDDSCRVFTTENCNENICNDDDDINDIHKLFSELRNVRIKSARNIVFGHININSIRNKFTELNVILKEHLVDVLVVSEVKLDETFSDVLFHIKDYCMYRQDYTARSGGIIVYVRDSIANNAGKISINEKMVQCLSVQLVIDKNRYTLIAIYKNPKCTDMVFEQHFEKIYDEVTGTGYESILIGDLNFNMIQPDCFLHDLCDRYSLTNLVKSPTCFKSENPTLIDVILVSNKNMYMRSFVCDIHISDFHFMVGTVMRKFLPAAKVKYKYIRKLKRIDYEVVKSDMEQMCILNQVQQELDPSLQFKTLQSCLISIINKHAPKSKVKVTQDCLPKMSKELKRNILRRNMLRNKFFKKRSCDTFTEYRKMRNKVNILKRKEINKLFKERCNGGSRNAKFWETVKPYFTRKGSVKRNIMLCENNEIRTDTTQICEIFNEYFVKIGSDIGVPEPEFESVEEIFTYYENTSIITNIKNNVNKNKTFYFKQVTEQDVLKVIKDLKVNKATGPDEIPPVFVKSIALEITPLITYVINECIWQNIFPADMKVSNITPLFKKKDSLCKENYRSVNVLTTLSKIFERILYNQQNEYFKDIFDKLISGFRKGHSCCSMLLKLTEDVRKALDQGHCMGIVAMDLSKAFDIIPRGLFVAKLKAYGYNNSACEMMLSYLTNRKQRVKIDDNVSPWVNPTKGVPQGSILGPLVFNIFMNDFFLVNFNSLIYNYADDNTLALIGPDFDTVKYKMEVDAKKAVHWFNQNGMKANPEKFQVMFMGKNVPKRFKICIYDINIESSENIEILGIILDTRLKFDLMVRQICRKVSCQINVLQRLRSKLDENSRMAAYNAFIMSNLVYCQIIWMYCGMKNINKLENLNKRALRFVNNDYESDYDVQLQKADKNRLLTQRIINMGVEVFKAKVGISPIYIQEMLTGEIMMYNLRARNTLVQPAYKTRTYGYRSFSYMGPKLWNSMTNELREAPTLPCFIERLRKWAKSLLNVNEYL